MLQASVVEPQPPTVGTKCSSFPAPAFSVPLYLHDAIDRGFEFLLIDRQRNELFHAGVHRFEHQRRFQHRRHHEEADMCMLPNHRREAIEIGLLDLDRCEQSQAEADRRLRAPVAADLDLLELREMLVRPWLWRKEVISCLLAASASTMTQLAWTLQQLRFRSRLSNSKLRIPNKSQ